MAKSINRRELITLAAAAGAAAIVSPAMAQTSSPDATATGPAPATTPETEGEALADAALASAGHPLPADQVAEVKKQLSTYPGDFAKARKFPLANGDAPIMGVTPALPNR